MHCSFFLSLVAVLIASPIAAQSSTSASNAPLPNPTELLQRAIADEHKLAAERERYDCRVTGRVIQTDSKGNTKKDTTEVSELFYVNGIPIERTLQKNGKDLTPEETKKEDERVMKETLKYNDQANAQKEENKQIQNIEDLLQAMMLANGRRQNVDGRSVLVYDIVPNPHFEAKNLLQRMAQVMQGKMSFDEQTGRPIDIDVKTVADFKVGGGLLADVHKGLWLHLHNQMQPDGVWLPNVAEGSGDARAALFLHPYFRFREVTDNCKLYTATAVQVGPAQPVKKP
jgi:hypothetical protein